jgi:hypothetical protein
MDHQVDFRGFDQRAEEIVDGRRPPRSSRLREGPIDGGVKIGVLLHQTLTESPAAAR